MPPAECEINVMFVTDKGNIKELQQIPLASGELLVNLCVPNVVSGGLHKILNT